MLFLRKDNKLLEKHNEIWDRVSNAIKKGFDSEPVHNGKYLKTKIKSYEGKVNINFHNDKMPKKVLIEFVYEWYGLTLFLEWVKTIMLNCC